MVLGLVILGYADHSVSADIAAYRFQGGEPLSLSCGWVTGHVLVRLAEEARRLARD